MYKKMRGVTLVELMIVVIVLGILAAVAYPNYRDVAARAKRYLNNNTYTTDMTQLGFAGAGNVVTESGSYRINVDAADANNFTATATYLNAGNEAGRCATFQIDGRGVRTSAPLADCWTRTR